MADAGGDGVADTGTKISGSPVARSVAAIQGNTGQFEDRLWNFSR